MAAIIIIFFVDDLSGTSENEMEQRVVVRVRKDFQFSSEDWNDAGQIIRWAQDPRTGSYIEGGQEKTIEDLEEIPLKRNTNEDLQCTPTVHTMYRSLLGQMNWLQSRT